MSGGEETLPAAQATKNALDKCNTTATNRNFDKIRIKSVIDS